MSTPTCEKCGYERTMMGHCVCGYLVSLGKELKHLQTRAMEMMHIDHEYIMSCPCLDCWMERARSWDRKLTNTKEGSA